jgi:predicted enzyme related to lactoylglutathione lyase
MLSQFKIVAFVNTTDAGLARDFYEGKLGLTFVSDDPFAIVFNGNGTNLRAAKVKEFTPAPSTVLGWEVSDISQTVAGLISSGIVFEIFGFIPQDPQGIWDAPGGARVAWFKDPSGNLLSLSQHPA